jgi:hypothetical protein
MTQTIYGLIADHGDGSSGMHWFRDKALIDEILEDDERYYANEGVPAEVLTFPKELNLEECGFEFY